MTRQQSVNKLKHKIPSEYKKTFSYCESGETLRETVGCLSLGILTSQHAPADCILADYILAAEGVGNGQDNLLKSFPTSAVL